MQGWVKRKLESEGEDQLQYHMSGMHGYRIPEGRWGRTPTVEATARILRGQSWRSLRVYRDHFYFVGTLCRRMEFMCVARQSNDGAETGTHGS